MYLVLILMLFVSGEMDILLFFLSNLLDRNVVKLCGRWINRREDRIKRISVGIGL